MTEPFKPKGERSEWRMIYDALLADADYGDVISYQQLSDVLGRDFLENRTPIYRARNELCEARKRWIEADPGVGYRVIEANEHIMAAEARKRRARHHMRMMVKVTNGTDLSRLTPAELVQFDIKTKVNMALYGVLMHEHRLRRIEGILAANGLV